MLAINTKLRGMQNHSMCRQMTKLAKRYNIPGAREVDASAAEPMDRFRSLSFNQIRTNVTPLENG
jgi:hypothetical protein